MECPARSTLQITLDMELNSATLELVGTFAQALASKLADAEKNYGYSDGWARNDWMDECRAKLVEHVGKGDPRDVAAYCAFLWYHGERTAGATAQARLNDADTVPSKQQTGAMNFSLGEAKSLVAFFGGSNTDVTVQDFPAHIVDGQVCSAGKYAWCTEYPEEGACWLGPPDFDIESPHHKLDTATHVFFYEQDFYVLSNFSSFRLDCWGLQFQTSEAAYHWMKFANTAPAIAEEIRLAPSAHEAFKLAERHTKLRRPDWDGIKVDVMRGILRAKAEQHEYVRRKLLATGDRILVEDSWRDAYWGWGPNLAGQNMLGRLWMEVRHELRDDAPVLLKGGNFATLRSLRAAPNQVPEATDSRIDLR
ncbi:MAG: hypothetical protein BGP25_05590 [Lysobacterales bacterium 63-13]|nr:MAG: hypothetical protein BGP25_05590 [Xanthomonadales bacterium 63-13]